MAISAKKYELMLTEAGADAIRFRKERDAARDILRVVGRLSDDPRIVDLCKAAIAGTPLPDDTRRIDALEVFVNEYGALVLHTGDADCGKYSGLGLRPGVVRRTLREAIDDMSAGMETKG